MIKNRQLQRSSSKMTQSQTSLMNQSITQTNSIRKQSSIIYFEDQEINNVTQKLLKKISQKQSRQSVDDITKLIPINNDIQNVYNSFEDNFRVVKESNRVTFEVPQPKKQEYVKKEQFAILKPIDGLQFCDLSSETLNRIQINRLKFFYFRTKLKNKLNPLQIYFNFPEQTQNQIYRVFLSTSVEFPTKFNCEQTTSSRSIKIKTKSGTKFFTEDYLYFTLYAETDFFMTIHLVFGEFHCSFFVQKSSDHLNYFKYWEDNKKSVSPRKDKIIQNLDQTKYKSQNKLKEFLKISENSAKKIISVVQRGKFLEKEKQLQRTIKLAVKSQILEFRKVEKSILISKCEKMNNCTTWSKVLNLLFLSEQIYKILHNKKRELRIKAKAKLMVWQLKIKLMMEVQQYGQNPLDRGHNKAMILLEMVANHVSKLAKSRAKKVATSFLKKILLFQTALNAHQKMSRKVKVILKLFKTKKFQKKAFRDRFWRQIKHYLSQNSFSTTFFTSGQIKNMQIEKPVMSKIMDQYIDNRRAQWILKMRDQREKQKLDPNIEIEEYKIYKLPDENELKMIIKEYYFQKKSL